MSFSMRFFRFRLSGMKVCRSVPLARKTIIPKVATYEIPTLNLGVRYTLGFSIFTWLGFEKPLSAEDELIQTIKHCVLFVQKMEFDKAEQLLHVALRQAQQINNQLGITYIYDIMANLALEREQLDKAKKLFVEVAQRVMADGAQEDDSRVVHISIKLARISHLKKDYTTAQLGYDWCLQKLNNEFLREPSDGIKTLIALTHDWYGRLFLDCGQSEQALNYMVKALEHMRELPGVEPEHIVIQLNDIGTVYDQIGKPDEGITYLQEAINMGKQLNMDDLGAMHVNLGKVYIKKNMLAEARKNCGYGWKLGVLSKNNETKQQASDCLTQIKEMS